jgi:signal transduction histidine kinase
VATPALRGRGVPVEHRERIFERFYRAHSGSHDTGMGLGRYISREIVELHGGTISAEFPPEGGSCFIMRLPLSVAAQASDAIPSSTVGGAQG